MNFVPHPIPFYNLRRQIKPYLAKPFLQGDQGGFRSEELEGFPRLAFHFHAKHQLYHQIVQITRILAGRVLRISPHLDLDSAL